MLKYKTKLILLLFSLSTNCFSACLEGERANDIDKLSELAQSLSDNVNGQFFSKSKILVDIKCAGKYGEKDFVKTIDNSIEQGIRCLNKLGTSRSRDHGAKIRKYKTRRNNPLKITCSDESTNWSTLQANAFASVAEGDTLKASKNQILKHPYISLDPTQNWSLDLQKLKKTFFHEIMHTLGYKHGRDVEYSFACADCCISPEKGEAVYYSASKSYEDRRVKACKICKGDYSGISDRQYIEDMIDWKSGQIDEKNGRRTLLELFRLSPNDKWGKTRLITFLKSRAPKLAEELSNSKTESKLAQTIFALMENDRTKAAKRLAEVIEDDITDPYSKGFVKDLKKELRVELIFSSPAPTYQDQPSIMDMLGR
ncbi:MAG: hypothetical protein KAG61_01685 [Bacteriovoracaceae bacterium]|nr:hypothetical protein [Bacteriovoracaceae bacterium]